MKRILSLTLPVMQAFGQTPATAPTIVYEEVTHVDPGLYPDKTFDQLLGKPVQAFEFLDLAGHHWKSSELKGKVVYLNIWFTGCPPCVIEIPELNSIHSEFRTTEDVLMLSIAMDSEDVLKKFISTHPINLPLASVSMSQIKGLAMPAGAIGFPTHLIIDRAGNLAVASRGGSSKIGKQLRFSLKSVAARPTESSKK